MGNAKLTPALGEIDGVNTLFATPSPYWPGTLWVALRGVFRVPGDADAATELGGVAFSLPRAPYEGDRVLCWYHETAPEGGAFEGPPDLAAAIEIRPCIRGLVGLVPVVQTDPARGAVVLEPVTSGAVVLRPDVNASIDLRPVNVVVVVP